MEKENFIYNLRLTQEQIRAYKGESIVFDSLIPKNPNEIIIRVENPKIYVGKDFNIALPYFSEIIEGDEVNNSQEWADELYIIETVLIV